jgi:hypothetical protein
VSIVIFQKKFIMIKNNTSSALLFLLLCLTGCGTHVGLSGKVIFSDDGSPLTIGTVCFEADNFLARANLRPDGTFVVGSVRQTDGLPPGEYRSYIIWARKPIGTTEDGETIYEPLIDPKHTCATTSDITINITSTTRNFEIVVDRYQQ